MRFQNCLMTKSHLNTFQITHDTKTIYEKLHNLKSKNLHLEGTFNMLFNKGRLLKTVYFLQICDFKTAAKKSPKAKCSLTFKENLSSVREYHDGVVV